MTSEFEAVARVFRCGGDFYDMLKSGKETDKMQIICKHCGEESRHVGRGLCNSCYRDKGIRNQYPAQVAVEKTGVCARAACGREFQRGEKNQRYCSAECRKAENRERESARLRAETKARAERKKLNPNPWQVFVSDPFTRDDFYGADGLPGLHAMVCPMG